MSNKGFTLLEVMVATAILSIGVTTVLTGLSMAVNTVSLVQGYETATTAAESKLAEIIDLQPDIPFQQSGVFEPFNYTWLAEGTADESTESVFRYKVTVLFTSGGKERSVILETAEAERNLPKQIISRGQRI